MRAGSFGSFAFVFSIFLSLGVRSISAAPAAKEGPVRARLTYPGNRIVSYFFDEDGIFRGKQFENFTHTRKDGFADMSVPGDAIEYELTVLKETLYPIHPIPIVKEILDSFFAPTHFEKLLPLLKEDKSGVIPSEGSMKEIAERSYFNFLLAAWGKIIRSATSDSRPLDQSELLTVYCKLNGVDPTLFMKEDLASHQVKLLTQLWSAAGTSYANRWNELAPIVHKGIERGSKTYSALVTRARKLEKCSPILEDRIIHALDLNNLFYELPSAEELDGQDPMARYFGPTTPTRFFVDSMDSNLARSILVTPFAFTSSVGAAHMPRNLGFDGKKFNNPSFDWSLYELAHALGRVLQEEDFENFVPFMANLMISKAISHGPPGLLHDLVTAELRIQYDEPVSKLFDDSATAYAVDQLAPCGLKH